MIAAPFEVVPVDGGFTWRLIGSSGRALVYTDQIYASDFEAADAAKAIRQRMAEAARRVDADRLMAPGPYSPANGSAETGVIGTTMTDRPEGTRGPYLTHASATDATVPVQSPSAAFSGGL